jgi:hypothetical protein
MKILSGYQDDLLKNIVIQERDSFNTLLEKIMYMNMTDHESIVRVQQLLVDITECLDPRDSTMSPDPCPIVPVVGAGEVKSLDESEMDRVMKELTLLSSLFLQTKINKTSPCTAYTHDPQFNIFENCSKCLFPKSYHVVCKMFTCILPYSTGPSQYRKICGTCGFPDYDHTPCNEFKMTGIPQDVNDFRKRSEDFCSRCGVRRSGHTEQLKKNGITHCYKFSPTRYNDCQNCCFTFMDHLESETTIDPIENLKMVTAQLLKQKKLRDAIEALNTEYDQVVREGIELQNKMFQNIEEFPTDPLFDRLIIASK